MTHSDPFAAPPPERNPRAGEHEGHEPGAGHGAPGYAAPGYTATPQPAPALGDVAAQGAGQPWGQPTPYGNPGPARVPTDGVSIAAMVTGLLGLGVVGVVLGAIGLRRTAGAQRKGTGMAWAGVILGLVGTIIWSVGLTWGVAGASSLWDAVETGTESEARYGDDPFLDGLWDQCEAGDMVACDDLYYESPFGSEYEDFGWECGGQGRGVLEFNCADEE